MFSLCILCFFAAPFILILIISKHSAHLQIVQTKHQNTKSHYHHYPTSLVHKMQIVVKKYKYDFVLTCSFLVFHFVSCSLLFPVVTDIVVTLCFLTFHNFLFILFYCYFFFLVNHMLFFLSFICHHSFPKVFSGFPMFSHVFPCFSMFFPCFPMFFPMISPCFPLFSVRSPVVPVRPVVLPVEFQQRGISGTHQRRI